MKAGGLAGDSLSFKNFVKLETSAIFWRQDFHGRKVHAQCKSARFADEHVCCTFEVASKSLQVSFAKFHSSMSGLLRTLPNIFIKGLSKRQSAWV